MNDTVECDLESNMTPVMLAEACSPGAIPSGSDAVSCPESKTAPGSVGTAAETGSVITRICSGFVSVMAVILVGCQPTQLSKAPATDKASNVVATVESLSITREDLAEAMKKRFRAQGEAPLSTGFKQEVLDAAVQEKVLLGTV